MKPLEIDFYTQSEFKKTVNTLLANEHFDVGISFFMRPAEYIRKSSIPHKILIAEDCRVLYQSRSVENTSNPLQKLVRLWEVLALKKYEPAVANDFNVTTCVTHTDISAMQERNPHADYRLLTNGVNVESYVYRDEHKQRKDIIFFGKLDTLANEIMALRIAEKILPLVMKECPDVKFHLVGASPRPYLKQLASDNIIIHENVPNITEPISQAAVMVHPHAGASGIQNKVLEAMALGCPVVTSPTGIQGIDAEEGSDVCIAQSDHEFAKKTVSLLKNPQKRSRMACNACHLIERNHTWKVIGSQMDEILRSLLPEETPQKNGTSQVASHKTVVKEPELTAKPA
jgi:glycosyltransferase involved in cell wall biosynthesis